MSTKVAPGRFEYWLRQVVIGSVFERLGVVWFPLARLWRGLMRRTTFVAVTGAVGKTTAKECAGFVLASGGRTFRSHRNQNAQRKVPLNVLRVRPWHRYAVIEVGSGAPGRMEPLARVVRPDVAVILCVARTHSTEYRDLEQHADEKAVLLRYVRKGGLALLNGDDPLVAAMREGFQYESRLFGRGAHCDYRATQVESKWPGRLRFVFHARTTAIPVQTRLVGEHWLHSAMASLALADSLGLDLQAAAEALGKTDPFPGRLAPYRLPSGAVVLRDDYNAAVPSLEASLQVLKDAAANRKILVITDFSDLDGNSKRRRRALASKLPGVADGVVFVGEAAEYGARRAVEAGLKRENTHGFEDLQEAAIFLRRELRDGDLVLLKGRTTDHAARLFLAQLGDLSCWRVHCPKRMLCDICWELGMADELVNNAVRDQPQPPQASVAAADALRM